jgi:Asp-tRNA(Asn)/Glu-tRNA(Gln) amidotransferase A subunit family amidase
MTSRAERAARRIDARTDLRAFVFVDREAGGRGPIVGVKDNIDVRGMPTLAGGRHLPSTPRLRDAECVRRLRHAGCMLIGKTNLYEYAMGGTSRNEHFGDVRNPRSARRDAGGSSSGSAAAVAAGLCDAALGTDTLGSVRIPAAFCGVVGYKPPRAAISRRGVFPNTRSLDAVGVLAPDVSTAARIVDLMRASPVSRARTPRSRLAVPWAWLATVSDDVRHAFLRSARDLEDITLPPLEAYGPTAFGVLEYESYTLHRRWFRTTPERYGTEVRDVLAQSARATRASHDSARSEMLRLRRATRRALATVDAILLPTVPFTPPLRARYPLALRRKLSAWTLPFNVSDSAVFSIPIPGTRLPIGLQIVANDEASAISVALRIERDLSDGWRLT